MEIYGIRAEKIPPFKRLIKVLPLQWVVAWSLGHPKASKRSQELRQSLGGLYLLFRAGATGFLVYDKSGRPYFLEENSGFSISHTRGYVVCAHIKREGARVGVDVERTGRIPKEHMLPMAERWFSAEERKGMPPGPDEEAFLRIWTRKEALLKYRGVGLDHLREADTEPAEGSGELAFSTIAYRDLILSICAEENEDVPHKVIWIK